MNIYTKVDQAQNVCSCRSMSLSGLCPVCGSSQRIVNKPPQVTLYWCSIISHTRAWIHLHHLYLYLLKNSPEVYSRKPFCLTWLFVCYNFCLFLSFCLNQFVNGHSTSLDKVKKIIWFWFLRVRLWFCAQCIFNFLPYY